MLNLDINHLTPAELEEAVYYYCSQCGTVKNIRFHGLTDGSEREVAAVEMSSSQETDRLVYYNIGDLKFGDTAIIRLSADDPESAYLAGDNGGRTGKPEEWGDPLEILLIEDDPRAIHRTREALKASGVPHNVNSVDDGLDAMLYLHRSRRFHDVPAPDIILVVELTAPDAEEDEVLSEIRACESLYNIPVVVMRDLDAESVVRLLADRFVTKQPDVEGFAREMRKIDNLAWAAEPTVSRTVPFVERRAPAGRAYNAASPVVPLTVPFVERRAFAR